MNLDNYDMDLASLGIPKRLYSTPELIEHGDIHSLVHRQLVFGNDGGLPVDNDS